MRAAGAADPSDRPLIDLEHVSVASGGIAIHIGGARASDTVSVGKSVVLPTWQTRFVGRARELKHIDELLKMSRLVTLTGPGGCGKTRLAVETLRRREGHSAERTWFVNLADVVSDRLVVTAVWNAVGLRPVPESTRDGLVAAMHGWTATVVLDNCEHLLDETALVVQALLLGCAGLRMLVTSREPLGLPGERVYRTDPLDAADARCLFEDRAQYADASFSVGETHVTAVEGICARLDGLPLALELAAACVGSMTPELIVDRLDSRFHFLIDTSKLTRARHRTLSAAIEWSDDLLSPAERVLFHRLGVFAGGFELRDAEAVTAGGGLPANDVLPLLRRLVEQSLVQTETTVTGRYRLLETIREHAMARLIAEGYAEPLRDAHATYFSSVAWLSLETWMAHGLTHAQFAELERALPNFRAAIQFLRRGGSIRFARLVVGMAPLWHRHALFEEGKRWMLAALATSPVDADIRHHLLFNLAWIGLRLGEIDASRFYAQEALVHSEMRSDVTYTARSLVMLQYVEVMAGNIEVSRRHAEGAVEFARRSPNVSVRNSAVNNLSNSLRLLGELERAEALALEAVAIARECSLDEQQLAASLDSLALVQVERGDVESALATQREALSHAPSADDQLGCLATMAGLLAARGQTEAAVRLAGAVDAGIEALGLHPLTVWEDTIGRIEVAQRAVGRRASQVRSKGHRMSISEAWVYAMEASES